MDADITQFTARPPARAPRSTSIDGDIVQIKARPPARPPRNISMDEDLLQTLARPPRSISMDGEMALTSARALAQAPRSTSLDENVVQSAARPPRSVSMDGEMVQTPARDPSEARLGSVGYIDQLCQGSQEYLSGMIAEIESLYKQEKKKITARMQTSQKALSAAQMASMQEKKTMTRAAYRFSEQDLRRRVGSDTVSL